MKSRIVGLDLETTSLNPYAGDIIEIGASIYEKGKQVDSLQILVKPSSEIPRYVSAITGISDGDVVDAKDFDDVKEDLVTFVGDLPIIGHNIFFDIDFLKAKGVDFTLHAIYDTWKIATLVVDSAPSLSLEVLSKHLNILHVDSHRALDDAQASVELFYELNSLIEALPLESIEVVLAFIKDKNYVFAHLFEGAAKRQKQSKKQKSFKLDIEKNLIQLEIDIDEIDYFEEEMGIQGNALISPEQKSLTEKLNTDIRKSIDSIIECPKGINQTLGALLSVGTLEERCALLIHDASEKESLFKEDVSTLKKLTGRTFFPLFLGRQTEYFCLQRFDAYVERGNHNKDELHLIVKVLLWLEGTRTGLLSELNTTYEEYDYLEALRSDSELCDEKRCLVYGGCFYHKAIKSSGTAQLIVTWQDTIFEDTEFLKERHLIIASSEKFDKSYIKHTKKFLTPAKISSSMGSLKRFLEGSDTNVLSGTDVLVERIDEMIGHIDLSFGLIGVASKSYPDISYERITINKNYLAFHTKSVLKSTVEKTLVLFNEFVKEIKNADIYTVNQKFIDVYVQKIGERVRMFVSFFELNDTVLREILLGEEHVFLVEVPLIEKTEVRIEAGVSKHFLGKNIAKRRQRALGYFIDINSFEMQEIVPPIIYSEHVSVYAIKDMPPENDDSYYTSIQELVNHLYQSSERGVVVVFKNKGKLTNYFKQFGLQNKKSKRHVFYTGVMGGPSKIQGLMKGVKKPILFTTVQLLQETKLQSDRFSSFAIDRLPFQPPTPLEIKTGESSFMKNALPRAVDVFKDVFDFTLEHKDDSAAFIVLDPKATQARYASSFFREVGAEAFQTLSFEQFMLVENISKPVDK